MTYKIYNKAPVFLKKALKKTAEIFLPFPYKYGIGFTKKYRHQMKYFNWLMKTQWFSPVDIDNLQNERLQIIIKHAYENVPYYTKLFNENKIKPNDINTKDDLKEIPILTKKIIRENFKQLTAKNAEKFLPLKKKP